MIPRHLAIGLLSAGCVSAAAAGSYIAVRQNTAELNPAPVAAPVTPPAPAVNESEGVVAPGEAARELTPEPVEPPREASPPKRTAPSAPARRQPARETPVRRPAAVRAAQPAPESIVATSEAIPAVASADGPLHPAADDPSGARVAEFPSPVELPPTPAAVVSEPGPVIEEIVLPAHSVIGLELESTVTTERARIEDRVDARVTRDVYADGRLAIPAGSRVIGAVTTVERGGKVKERARLGVRFHTLVLAGGRQFDLRTEPIFREGESPANDSSRKIGGAAIGGAVLGAIIGGKKGAIVGATTGAAGGTAVVMAGDRKAATLAAGSVVTVKLTAPVTVQVER